VRPLSTEPDEPEPDQPRRRYGPVVVGVLVVAGLAFAGYLAWRGTPAPHRVAATDPTFPSVEFVPSSVDPPSASVPPTPSATASPPRPVATSHRATPRATTPASSAPTPVRYGVPSGDLCGYVDFTPVDALSSPPGVVTVDGYRKDYPASGDTLYVCDGHSGGVNIHDIDVMVYPTASQAAAQYAEAKSFAPAGARRIDGVGNDAYGYVWSTTSYRVVALAGNITFRITLTPRTTPAPGTDQLGTAAITIARTTIPKLSR
jgi:hypothetical protein